MKKYLIFLGVLPLLCLMSCLGTQEAENASSSGASEFNQRVAEDIRNGDDATTDSTSRAARRQARAAEKP